MIKYENKITVSDVEVLFNEFTEKHKHILTVVHKQSVKYICSCKTKKPMDSVNWLNEIQVCPESLKQLRLNKEEIFACIAHEFGHLQRHLNKLEDNGNREFEADEYACKLGYKQELISVVNKLIANRAILNFSDEDIENLKLRLQKLQQEE